MKYIENLQRADVFNSKRSFSRSVNVLSHFCEIFWPRYLLSALIYMAAVAAVDPDLIVDALIPLATALAYVMVVFSRLKAYDADVLFEDMAFLGVRESSRESMARFLRKEEPS